MSQLRIGCEFRPKIMKKVYKHVWGLEVAGFSISRSVALDLITDHHIAVTDWR